MQTLELIELSALAAIHSPSFVTGKALLPTEAIADVWTASRARLDLWDQALRTDEGEIPRPAVLREILAAEVLSRVWAAITTARDAHTGRQEASPMARSVLAGHASISHRALRAIVSLDVASSREAERLNQLRARCERWTDYLIGHIGPTAAVIRFAFDPRRADTFHGEPASQSARGQQASSLLSAAINRSFASDLGEPAPHAVLNKEIAAGVLACFLPEMISGDSAIAAPWQSRLEDLANHAEGMLSHLLHSNL